MIVETIRGLFNEGSHKDKLARHLHISTPSLFCLLIQVVAVGGGMLLYMTIFSATYLWYTGWE